MLQNYSYNKYKRNIYGVKHIQVIKHAIEHYLTKKTWTRKELVFILLLK